MLERIETAQRKYAVLFADDGWKEDELSNIGWLGLVGVPWLVAIVQNEGRNEGKDRDTNGDPGAHGVRLPEPSLEFVLPKNPVADSPLVVITGNPIAKFLICFIAKIVGVRFVCHVSSNVRVKGRAACRRVPLNEVLGPGHRHRHQGAAESCVGTGFGAWPLRT